jgi:hypothetical protein
MASIWSSVKGAERERRMSATVLEAMIATSFQQAGWHPGAANIAAAAKSRVFNLALSASGVKI